MKVDDRMIRAWRHTRPDSPDALWNWVYLVTGVKLARAHVCRDHSPPFEYLSRSFFSRPPISLTLGSRGSGKSFISAIHTHMQSRFHPRHETRILGGSEAQSFQIYQGIKEAFIDADGPPPWHLNDRDVFMQGGINKTFADYRNGSRVEILPASTKSARGPHIPLLNLDEVDEIDPEVREAALGMCMTKLGHTACIMMTSTWHRLGGPMTELLDKAREMHWPLHTFCAFDVAERCPEERSGRFVGGPALFEKCPQCPLVKWCHSERDRNGDKPLLKLSDGHYSIDALIQKAQFASARIFEADYLCKGPKADGIWFSDFDEAQNVSLDAEFDPRLDVHFALDTGVRTGGVYFQVRLEHDWKTGRRNAFVNVFGDYYQEHLVPSEHVKLIYERSHDLCGGRLDRRWTDPAGKARNSSGTVTLGEFLAAGLALEPWPKVGIRDALTLVESLVKPAYGTPRLKIHPRCKHLINAMRSYRRAKVRGVYVDHPEEPQHPAENLVDPLKNGLVAVIGLQGLAPTPMHRRIDPRQVF